MTLEPFGPEEPSKASAIIKAVVGGALGSVPVVGPMLAAAQQAAAEHDIERRIRFAEFLAIELRGVVEELRMTEPDVADAVARALAATAEARDDDKIRLLAAVAVHAMRGGTATQEAHILLSVIRDLEPSHVHLLVAVDQISQADPPLDEIAKPDVPGARRDALESSGAVDPELVGILINDLAAHCLIHNAYASTYGILEGKEAFVLTPLGRGVLDLLSDRSAEQPDT